MAGPWGLSWRHQVRVEHPGAEGSPAREAGLRPCPLAERRRGRCQAKPPGKERSLFWQLGAHPPDSGSWGRILPTQMALCQGGAQLPKQSREQSPLCPQWPPSPPPGHHPQKRSRVPPLPKVPIRRPCPTQTHTRTRTPGIGVAQVGCTKGAQDEGAPRVRPGPCIPGALTPTLCCRPCLSVQHLGSPRPDQPQPPPPRDPSPWA